MTANPLQARLTPSRVGGEIAAIVVLSVVGMIVGALTPWVIMGPILGMVFPLLAATWFLQRQGIGWRDLGFPNRMPLGRFLWLTLAVLIATVVIVNLILTPVMRWLGAPPVDVSMLAQLIEGDFRMYLLFLIPVGWVSAAFGEELLMRGFVLNRLTAVMGTSWAVVLQALLFSLGHAYQGVTGMVSVFVVGVLLAIVYLRANRNLWPAIAAHGLINTMSITLMYLGYTTM
ncbi:MAG: CPBP family intramembrane glutamic endopeptidase [Pseudomonadales bacterium]